MTEFDEEEELGEELQVEDEEPEEGVATDPPAKRQKVSVGGTYRLILLVPGEIVSSLIGKQGSVIKEMEQQCGGIISFEKVDEVIMGDRLRSVSIFGESLDVLTEGQSTILSRMTAALRQAGHTDKAKLRMLVPNEFVGLIIGPRGAGINEITSQSKAFIGFCKAEEMPAGSVMRMCTISGEQENICMAQQMVTEKHEQLLMEMHKTTSGQIIKVGKDSRAIYGNDMPPMPAPPARQASSLKMALPSLSVAGAGGGGGGGRLPTPPRASRPPPPPPPQPGQHRAEEIPRQFTRGQIRERDSSPPPNRGRRTASPPPARVAFRDEAIPAANRGRVGSANSKAPREPREPVPGQLNFVVWVPNDRVAQLIGGRGANIKRITDTTRVYVSVQKEDATTVFRDFGAGPMRPVHLRGSNEAVLQAHSMVVQILTEIDPDMSFSSMVFPTEPAGDSER